jgi:hypothetical protein
MHIADPHCIFSAGGFLLFCFCGLMVLVGQFEDDKVRGHEI